MDTKTVILELYSSLIALYNKDHLKLEIIFLNM